MLKICLTLLALAFAAPALAEQTTLSIAVSAEWHGAKSPYLVYSVDAAQSAPINEQLKRGWQVVNVAISPGLIIFTLERSDLFADPKADPLTVEQIRSRARAAIEARRARGEEIPVRLVPDPSTY